MKFRVVSTVWVLLLSLSGPVMAQLGDTPAHPLGITPQMSRQALEQLIPLGDPGSMRDESVTYAATTAPVPNSLYTHYAYAFSDKGELCGVIASHLERDQDPYGKQLKVNFGKLKTYLSAQYGTSIDTDRLYEDSTLTAPEQWREALQKKQRGLYAFWKRDNGSKGVPDTISSVVLIASAPDDKVSAVTTYYIFQGCQWDVSY